MIQIFRKNWFVFSLLLLPYTILTRIWIFFEKPAIPVTDQAYTPVYTYLNAFLPDSYVTNVLIASVLVFLCAVLLNNIVIKNRITREMNLIPGMLFIFFSALHKEAFTVTPYLVSLFLLLIGFANIYRIYHRPFAGIYIFNAGLLIGLSTLVYVPHLIYLLFLGAALFTLRKFSLRDFIQGLTGFLTVFAFWGFISFWYELPYYYTEHLPSWFYLVNHLRTFKINEWFILLVTLITIVLAMFKHKSFVAKKSIQSQKKVDLLYYMLALGIAGVFISQPGNLFTSLLLVYLPISVFLAMVMNKVRNEPALELTHLFLLFFVVFSHFIF